MAKTFSQKAIDLIIEFECSGNIKNYLKAYKCPAGVWTIGAGTTKYANGIRVKEGDVISEEHALQELRHFLTLISIPIAHYTKEKLNQNQFDALCSFAYNFGESKLRTSTLFKKAKINPNDPTIRDEFKKWVYSNGEVLNGLVVRREKEANLYFKKL